MEFKIKKITFKSSLFCFQKKKYIIYIYIYIDLPYTSNKELSFIENLIYA